MKIEVNNILIVVTTVINIFVIKKKLTDNYFQQDHQFCNKIGPAGNAREVIKNRENGEYS